MGLCDRSASKTCRHVIGHTSRKILQNRRVKLAWLLGRAVARNAVSYKIKSARALPTQQDARTDTKAQRRDAVRAADSSNDGVAQHGWNSGEKQSRDNGFHDANR